MRLGTLFPLFLAAAVALAAASPAAAQPSLSFEPAAVVARGVTAGAESVFFGVAHERRGFVGNLIRRAELVADDDADGIARLELPAAVPPLSVWAVVDPAAGAYTLADPRQLDLSGLAISVASFGPRDRITVARDEVDLLVVRPGGGPDAGAWSLYASDDGASDFDGVLNHQVVVQVAAMKPLGVGLGGPAALVPGDLIVAVDPRSLRYGTLRVF